MGFMIPFLPLISGALGVVGAISQGNQQAGQLQFQADAAAYNAKQGQANAQGALRTADANEEAQRRKARGALGTERAALTQSGIGLEGTSGGVYEQSALNAELDALNIRYEGKQQADAYTTGSALDTQSARIAKSNASNARTNGLLNAGTAALTSYNNYENNKVLKKAAKT